MSLAKNIEFLRRLPKLNALNGFGGYGRNLRPGVRSPLVDYLKQLKSATVSAAASLPDGGMKLDWHGDSFDYWIRSEAELEAIVDYVADNPVSAGLVRSPEQWFFCSAHDRFLHDGENCGWLPGAARAQRGERPSERQ